MFETVMKLYRDYSGNGLMMAIFLLALLYLWFTEKHKEKRILFIYTSVAILVLFFMPVFSHILIRYFLDSENYYRILWLLPMNIIIAMAAIRLIHQKRTLGLAAVLLVILVGGKYVYKNQLFTPTENLYHLPQSVIEICDLIQIPDYSVKGVFPLELVTAVRQYSTDIYMPYGREMTVDRWGFGHELFDLMQADTIDAKALGIRAKDFWCHYIILPSAKPVEGDLQDYGYELFEKVEGYTIYFNDELSLLRKW